MTKIKFTQEQIKAIYDDIDRRIYMMVADDEFEDEYDLSEQRAAMHQGVYAALSTLSSNWPEVRGWTDAIECGKNIC